MSEANIFVLIKTSSEDEEGRRLKDVFIKTDVCWVVVIHTPKTDEFIRALSKKIELNC